MVTPELSHAFEIRLFLSAPSEVGGPAGRARRIIPIVGGEVDGKQIKGEVLDIGADWQTLAGAEMFDIDARYAIRTDDGAVIEVISQGLRVATAEIAEKLARGDQVNADQYYMRTFIRLSSGHEDYVWVNKRLFLATGEKCANSVILQIYQID